MGQRRLRFSVFLVSFSLALSLLLPGTASDSVRPAQATTLTVNATADDAATCAVSGTVCLREAISGASAGDTIQFSVTGTITLSRGVLTIGKNLTITGPGANQLTISGTDTYQVFNINSGLTVNLSNITIAHGSSSNGGGVFAAKNSILNISDSTFSRNNAGVGAGIFSDATLNVNNSIFSNNSAGGLGQGGGIYSSALLNITNSVFVGNSALLGSGILTFGSNGIVRSIAYSTFSHNSLSQGPFNGSRGGAILNDEETGGSGSLNVTNSTFFANMAQRGGAIENSGQQGHAVLNIANSTFVQNGTSTEFGEGGAINNDGQDGSAILNIANSTFSANSSTSIGGAIENNGDNGSAYSNIVNSTFSGNSAAGGGGIHSIDLVNVGPTVVLKNSIVTHNTVDNCEGSTFALINTLSDSTCPGTTADVTNLDMTLRNNGGPTQTFALLAGSNAINAATDCTYPAGFPSGTIFDGGAGTRVVHDQRGVARRTSGACDIGSYQYVALPDTIGLFSPPAGQFYLRNSNSAGNADFIFSYGPPSNTWRPLAGDWIGQGKTTIGLYDPATAAFYLRNSNSAGNANFAFQYGPATGMIPIVGDWTGQGKKTIGVYDPANGNFALRNSNSSGLVDIFFQYGPPNAGLTPIVGDWTNKGYDSVGLYNQANAFFYLKNCNAATCASADTVFQYGPATSNGGAPATPVIGHWVSDNPATIGVYVPANAYWYLRNTNTAGSADNQFQYGPGPNAGWLPVIGHWGTPGTIAQPATTVPERYPIAPLPNS